MQTNGAIRLRTGPSVLSGNLTKVFTNQIGMMGYDRTINQPDHHFRVTAGLPHQPSEFDQIQRNHERLQHYAASRDESHDIEARKTRKTPCSNPIIT